MARRPSTGRVWRPSAVQTAKSRPPVNLPPTFEPRTSEPQPNNLPPIKKKYQFGRLLRRFILAIFLAALITAGCIAFWLYNTYNELSNGIQHVDVLSDAPDTNDGAVVYLIVGNDSRSLDADTDILGARSDTIMLLIHGVSGTDTLVSILRDTYLRIPAFVDEKGIFGEIGDKIPLTYDKVNASYSYGGPKLLVRTVELLTNLKVNHYVEVGFDGVEQLVNAVGGVTVCYDQDLDFDTYTGISWTTGCRAEDGAGALAFARLRYTDPQGDIGRARRQHEVINKVTDKVMEIVHAGNVWNLYNIAKLVPIAKTAESFLNFDSGMGIWDIKDLADRFKVAQSSIAEDNQVIPIEDPAGYSADIDASIVEIDGGEVRTFFKKLLK